MTNGTAGPRKGRWHPGPSQASQARGSPSQDREPSDRSQGGAAKGGSSSRGNTSGGRGWVPDPLRAISNSAPFRDDRQKRLFVRALHGHPAQSKVLHLLVATDKHGQARLRELVATSLGDEHPDGPAAGARCLAQVVAPLLDWIITANASSALSYAVNQVAAVVATAPRFLARLRRAVDAVLGDPALAAAAMEPPSDRGVGGHGTHWVEILATVATFCLLVLERFPRTRLAPEDWGALLGLANAAIVVAEAGGEGDCDEAATVAELPSTVAAFPLAAHGQVLRKAVAPLAALLAIKRRQAERVAKARERADADRRRRQFYPGPPSVLGGVTAAAATPTDAQHPVGPGGHPGGPRHDNDHDEARDISVEPTAAELLCSAPPYLPFPEAPPVTSTGGSSIDGTALPVSSGGNPGRLIDRVYRLTREDCVAPLRDAIQACVAASVAAGGYPLNATPRAGEDAPSPLDLSVYRDAQVGKVEVHNAGVGVKIRFKQPPGARGGSKSAADWWAAATERLRVGTLACLTRDLASATPNLAVGVIVGRDLDPSLRRPWEKNTPFHGPSITLSPCGTELGKWLSRILPPNGRAAGSSELLLLHLPADSFFSFAPVLRALARLEENLPFPSILACLPGGAPPPAQPAYLLGLPPAVRKLDLNVLVEDPARRSTALSAVDALVGDRAWPEAELRDRTPLDEAQLTALRAALSTSVCLVQGPPGTGKSFLSIRAVQLLSQRLDRLRDHMRAQATKADAERAGISRFFRQGGILVVTYTNHALDQFLLGMRKRGFSETGSVVRLGAPRDNPVLASMSLKTLRRLSEYPRSRIRRQQNFWSHKELQESLERVCEAKDHLEAVRKARMRRNHGGISVWSVLNSYLYSNYRRMHHSLQERNVLSEQPVLTGSASDTKSVAHSSQDEAPERTQETESSDPGESWHRAKGRRPESRRFQNWVRGNDLHCPKNRSQTASTPQEVPEAPAIDEVLETLSHAADAWKLPVPTRQRLLEYWLRGAEEAAKMTVSSKSADTRAILASRKQQRDEDDLRVLRNAKIVGATTTKAAEMQALIARWAPPVVVIEEAAEVLEAHSLAVLHGCVEQLLLIGDHKQLRPKVNVHELSVAGGRGYNMDVSLFERLAEGSRYTNVHQLVTQRRMRCTIAELVRDTVYPNLVDAPCVKAYPENVAGMGEPLYWWDHSEKEDQRSDDNDTTGTRDHSYSNSAEADRVKALVQYLIYQGYRASQLVVLTGYAGQLRLLRNRLDALTGVMMDEQDQEKTRGEDAEVTRRVAEAEVTRRVAEAEGEGSLAVDAHAGSGDDLVRLATVDNFQGEESDVVIVSMVRCNKRGNVGFLATPNRINVLLSRARHGLYLIASRSTVTLRGDLPGVAMLTRVTELLARRGAIGKSLPLRCQQHGKVSGVTSARDFAVKASEGGCTRACGFRLDCGHVCPRRCHPDDRQHKGSLAFCRAPCVRILPSALCTASHPCSQLCGDTCGPCRVQLKSVVLPCGHTREKVLCGEAAAGSLECTRRVAVTAPLCGHATTVTCAVAQEGKHMTSLNYCNELCGAVLPCGHSCAVPCHRCRSIDPAREGEERLVTVAHVSCTRTCDAVGDCGHECGLPCHAEQPCPPCGRPCERGCEHAACPRTCGEPCVPCLETCFWSCPHLDRSSSPGETPALTGHQTGSASARGPPMVRCMMPCGAPCDRLPCDRRCDLQLACGHRCPSVCGEVCPPARFCAECGEVWQKLSSEVVDMLTLTSLGEVDLDVDPVLVLPCGHIFPRSTLDEWMELPSTYSRSRISGAWMEPLPLQTAFSALKGCPFCRRQLQGIRRYGRPHMKARLDAAAEDHVRDSRRKLNALLQHFDHDREVMTAAAAAVDNHDATADGPTATSASGKEGKRCGRELDGAVKRMAEIAEEARQLARHAHMENPICRVFAAALAMERRGELATASSAAASSASDIADAVDTAGAGDGAGSSAAEAAAQRRLQIMKLPPPDLGVPCMAWMLAADAEVTVASGVEAGAAFPVVLEGTCLPKGSGDEGFPTGYRTRLSSSGRWDRIIEALTSAERCLEKAKEMATLGNLLASATAVLQRLTQLCERRVEVEFLSEDLTLATRARQREWLRRLDGVVDDLRASLATYPSISGTAWVANAVRRHEALRLRVQSQGVLSVAEKRSIFAALRMTPAEAAGHMFRCPSGHSYMVGDCGATNQVGRCPECGAVIGGTLSGPAPGNDRDPSYAHAPSRYEGQ